MPPPIAGEIDSGSFIVYQNGTPVCWIFSTKLNLAGTEYWYWKYPQFGAPSVVGDTVDWTIQRDTYATSKFPDWSNAYKNLANRYTKHVVSLHTP